MLRALAHLSYLDARPGRVPKKGGAGTCAGASAKISHRAHERVGAPCQPPRSEVDSPQFCAGTGELQAGKAGQVRAQLLGFLLFADAAAVQASVAAFGGGAGAAAQLGRLLLGPHAALRCLLGVHPGQRALQEGPAGTCPAGQITTEPPVSSALLQSLLCHPAGSSDALCLRAAAHGLLWLPSLRACKPAASPRSARCRAGACLLVLREALTGWDALAGELLEAAGIASAAGAVQTSTAAQAVVDALFALHAAGALGVSAHRGPAGARAGTAAVWLCGVAAWPRSSLSTPAVLGGVTRCTQHALLCKRLGSRRHDAAAVPLWCMRAPVVAATMRSDARVCKVPEAGAVPGCLIRRMNEQ